jgi:hypothetical protein
MLEIKYKKLIEMFAKNQFYELIELRNLIWVHPVFLIFLV